ncbi:hydroxyisourate hydrolase [soil metagenome]
MTTLSTHALDSALGRPAAGLEVALTGPDGVHLADAVTDPDGRVRFEEPVDAGVHRLTFATGPWFAAADRATLYPEVVLTFEIDPDQEHYHVALLLGPWSYTTYRGS